MRPAILDHCSGNKWTSTSHHPEFLVGEEVGHYTEMEEENLILVLKFTYFAIQLLLAFHNPTLKTG